jgi:GH15 family glucan-1,4-alpha-glucosidase
MPVGLPSDSLEYHHLYRRVRCVRGAVRISVACRPAFDYGQQIPTRIEANGAIFKAGRLTLALSTTVPLRDDRQGGSPPSSCSPKENRKSSFLGTTATREACHVRRPKKRLRHYCTITAPHCEILAGLALRLHLPRALAGSGAKISPSAKLLTFETGAIIAAPTKSLPEVIGGARN